MEILKTYSNGVLQEEALKLSKEAKKPMLSNVEHDSLLTGSEQLWKEYKDAYWAWTSTHISYKKGRTTAYVWNEGEKKKTKIFLPRNDGWYKVKNKYGIPNGAPSYESDPTARKLWRFQNRDYNGLVSRFYFLFGDLRVVVCYVVSGSRLGVLVKPREAGKNKPDAALIWLKKMAKHNKNAKEILKRMVD